MPKKVDRIIVDTNLWISFLISKNYVKLDEKIRKGIVKIVFSTASLNEFLEVTSRPKFRKYFSKTEIDSLLEYFNVYGELIDVRSKISVCRDAKDNFLLSLSADSKANYLITGDNDLLVLKQFGVTKIISMSNYFKEGR